MKNFSKLLYMLLLIGFIILGSSISQAQYPSGRAVYIQDNQDDTQSVVSVSYGVLLTLPKSYCIEFSSDLRYVATADREQLTTLFIYDLTRSDSLIREIPWQQDWTWPCAISWFDTQTVIVVTAWDDQEYYEIDVLTGSIIGPAPGAGPYEPLPNHDPESNIVVAASSTEDVVYSYCFGTIIQGAIGEACDGSSPFVIYDLQAQQVAFQLEHYNVPSEVHPVPSEMYFSWSPSGRYLAHLSTRQLVEIFDRSTNTYLDLSFIPQTMEVIYQNELYSWVWSPDEKEVAFWVVGLTDLGYPTDRGIVAVNFVDSIVRIIPVPNTETNAPRTRGVEWAWNLNGNGFYVLTTGLQLNQISFNGSITQIADQVNELFVTHVLPTTDLTGQLALLGQATSSSNYALPLTVKLVDPVSETVVNTYSLIPDSTGEFIVEDTPQGTYDIWVKHPMALAVMPEVELDATSVPFDFGTLLMGDANNDNMVGLADFSLLASSFGTSVGQPGYDDRADFNGDDMVTQVDFSILSSNYGEMGVPDPEPSSARIALLSSGTVDLTLNPEVNNVAVGQEFDITVQVEAGEQVVDGAAAILSFDPALLEVVSMTAGASLPFELSNGNDNLAGRISYAAGALENPPTGTFDLVTVRFRALAVTASTGIGFATDGATGVTYAGESVLNATEPGGVTITD